MVDLRIDPHPVQGGGGQDKQVPDAVVVLPAPGKGDHAQGVDQPAGQDIPQQGPGVGVELRDIQKAAPAQDKIEGEVQGPPAAGAESRHHHHDEEDDPPLDAKQRHPQHTPLIHQQDRREGPADEQIDGGVVKAPQHPLGGGAGGHGVVDAAHEHHDGHADPVEAGGQHLHPRVGPKQQRRHGRDGQQSPHTVADGVEDLLPHGQPGRLVFDPGRLPPPDPRLGPIDLVRCFHGSALLKIQYTVLSGFRYIRPASVSTHPAVSVPV